MVCAGLAQDVSKSGPYLIKFSKNLLLLSTNVHMKVAENCYDVAFFG